MVATVTAGATLLSAAERRGTPALLPQRARVQLCYISRGVDGKELLHQIALIGWFKVTLAW